MKSNSLKHDLLKEQVKRALIFLKEEEIQQQAMVPPQPAPQNPQTLPAQQQQNVGPKTEAGDPLTIDSLIDRLNVIRGGKSFNDPEVYGQLTTLYKSISDPEKVMLEKIISSIGKIVIDAAQQGQPQTMGTPQTPPPGNQNQTNNMSTPIPAQPAGPPPIIAPAR